MLNKLLPKNLKTQKGAKLSTQEMNLLKKGQADKGFSELLNKNTKGTKAKQASLLEVRNSLKDGVDLKEGFKSTGEQKLTNSKTSLLDAIDSSNTPTSDIENLLATKNFSNIESAKRELSSKLTKATKTPSLVTNGVEGNQEEIGTNTQELLDSLNKEPISKKMIFDGREYKKRNLSAKKAGVGITASGNDFLQTRQLVSNQAPKKAGQSHLSKFDQNTDSKKVSLISTKSLKSDDHGLMTNDLKDTQRLSKKDSQNALIGSLGTQQGRANLAAAQINLPANMEVLDLSAVTNPEQLIQEVSNYIEMNRIENSQTLEVLVKHNELGEFNVSANKGLNGLVEINIEAASEEAADFFKENEVKLLKNLDMKGVRVSEFKIQTSNNSAASEFASQSEQFNQEKKEQRERSESSSILNSTGNEFGYARQLDEGDLEDLQNAKDSRDARLQRWQEYNQSIGA